MSSYFSLLGGFFLVDRCNSAAIFLSNWTFTSAVNIDNRTLVVIVESGSTGGFWGCGTAGVVERWGVLAPVNPENNEEKKPPEDGCFTGLAAEGSGGFSVPEE